MTRVSAGTRRCPNCGRDITYPVTGDEVETPSLSPVPVPRAEGKRKAAAKERAPQAPRPPSAKPVSFTLDPAEVRALVAATPTLIEPGLRVYQDGGSVPTAVGEIDLLAVDDAGGLVVVMVADGEPGKEVVLELLERIGFVRTQVAERGQEVRGLLLAERLSEPTRYTIAALGGTVSVKSWRVGLSFDDLAV
jgi:hypothetical protein